MILERNKVHETNLTAEISNRFLIAQLVWDWWSRCCGLNPQWGQLFNFALLRQCWLNPAMIWQEMTNYKKNSNGSHDFERFYPVWRRQSCMHPREFIWKGGSPSWRSDTEVVLCRPQGLDLGGGGSLSWRNDTEVGCLSIGAEHVKRGHVLKPALYQTFMVTSTIFQNILLGVSEWQDDTRLLLTIFIAFIEAKIQII